MRSASLMQFGLATLQDFVRWSRWGIGWNGKAFAMISYSRSPHIAYSTSIEGSGHIGHDDHRVVTESIEGPT
jgi:hypothetical protein